MYVVGFNIQRKLEPTEELKYHLYIFWELPNEKGRLAAIMNFINAEPLLYLSSSNTNIDNGTPLQPAAVKPCAHYLSLKQSPYGNIENVAKGKRRPVVDSLCTETTPRHRSAYNGPVSTCKRLRHMPPTPTIMYLHYTQLIEHNSLRRNGNKWFWSRTGAVNTQFCFATVSFFNT